MGLLDRLFSTKDVREDKRSSRQVRQDNRSQIREASSSLCGGCHKHYVLNEKMCPGCGHRSEVKRKV